ncbi:MAG: mechanosensitive ion channel family protein, partial [Daejeonella sp.]
LENLSLRNLLRMRFEIGLRFDTPADVMMQISKKIEEFINQHPAIGDDTLVNFDSFGNSALNIQVIYFIKVAEGTNYPGIKEEINYEIMKIVSDHGAGFALPSQTVYHEYKGEKPGSEDRIN